MEIDSHEQALAIIENGLQAGEVLKIPEQLAEFRPEDIAMAMDTLSEKDLLIVFNAFPTHVSASILDSIESAGRNFLLKSLSEEKLTAVLEELTADDSAELIQHLPEERRDRILNSLQTEKGQQVQEVLRYEEGTAGSIMNPDVTYFREDLSVAQSIAKLRKMPKDELENLRLFTVDRENKLTGRVSLKRLVTASPRTKLSKLTDSDVFYVQAEADQEEAARIAEKYGVVLLPVVDDSHKLVGLIAADSIIDVIQEEATEDMMKMVGSGDDYELPFWKSALIRLPWLSVALVSGMLVSKFIDGFADSLEKIPLLASFIPLCMAMPGNVGSQSAMIFVRGLSTGHINTKRWLSFVGREVSIGAGLGATLGVLSGGGVYLLNYSVEIGAWVAVTVAVSMVCSMTAATLLGAMVPLILDFLKVDPAVGSGPFVTTINDMAGIMIYFGISVIMLGGVI